MNFKTKTNDKSVLYEQMPDGEVFVCWQLAVAYADYLGSIEVMEKLRQDLYQRGITPKEIDEAIVLYREIENIGISQSTSQPSKNGWLFCLEDG